MRIGTGYWASHNLGGINGTEISTKHPTRIRKCNHFHIFWNIILLEGPCTLFEQNLTPSLGSCSSWSRCVMAGKETRRFNASHVKKKCPASIPRFSVSQLYTMPIMCCVPYCTSRKKLNCFPRAPHLRAKWFERSNADLDFLMEQGSFLWRGSNWTVLPLYVWFRVCVVG